MEAAWRRTGIYICSITADADEFERAARGHWGVENNLHWQMDFTFRDDKNKSMAKTGPKTGASLKITSRAEHTQWQPVFERNPRWHGKAGWNCNNRDGRCLQRYAKWKNGCRKNIWLATTNLTGQKTKHIYEYFSASHKCTADEFLCQWQGLRQFHADFRALSV